MGKKLSNRELVRELIDEGRTTFETVRAELGMAEPRQSAVAEARQRELKRARKRAAEVGDYFQHLVAYIIVIGALFLINLLSGGVSWFAFPAIAWGIGLAFHTWSTFGPSFDKDWQVRKAHEWVDRAERRQGTRPSESVNASAAPKRSTTADPSAGVPHSLGALTEAASDEVDRLRKVARRIPKPEIRREALTLLTTADSIVLALGDGAGDEATARTFLDRYLGPTGTILSQYQRLTTREIASAAPALQRVEQHDLPLLNRRLQELYDRLHQGDVIDLQVASEMLAFELDEADPSGPALDDIAQQGKQQALSDKPNVTKPLYQ